MDIASKILAAMPCKAVFLPDAIEPVIERVTAPPELDNMQGAVGNGMVQLVSSFKLREAFPVQVFVNEEGRLKGMRINVLGTEFLRQYDARYRAEPPLVGPVVILCGSAAIWK